MSTALLPKARAVCQDGCLTNNNTVQGEDALSLTTGFDNSAFGWNALFSDTTGSENTAIGVTALADNTIGLRNTATGARALRSNIDGNDNTATGQEALASNTSGISNTATGSFALLNNTTGTNNTATGQAAMVFNDIGTVNTATGFNALTFNTSGSSNTATGVNALQNNTTASFNTATGISALLNNTTGGSNTATGSTALYSNTLGDNNTADGSQALFNVTGSGNIGLGYQAGLNLTTGSNNIDIGSTGKAGESGTIRIGTKGTHTGAIVAGIFGRTVTNGVAVLVNSNGVLGTTTSSARFKQKIRDMREDSEVLRSLRPVSFTYKPEIDPDGVPQFGLVAEDVAKVDPKLVVHDDNGEPYSVRYDAVNAMLLNEFLKQHRQMQQLQAMVAEQQEAIQQLKSHLASRD